MMRARVYVILSFFVVLAATVAATPFQTNTTYACTKTDQVLGITTWYRGLQTAADCSVEVPKKGADPDVGKFIMTIALNIIQAGLVIAAYVATFFIIKGGFVYITSAGSTDGMAAAKKTITNAIVGLVIAVFAAAIVNAIAGVI